MCSKKTYGKKGRLDVGSKGLYCHVRGYGGVVKVCVWGGGVR